MKSDTQTVTIEASPERVFRFVSDPQNLPVWAVNFCTSVTPSSDGGWDAVTPGGEVRLEVVSDVDSGVIDFRLSPAPDVSMTVTSRVVPNGEGAEYVFTQFQFPGMEDEQFIGQIRGLRQEMDGLPALIEASE